MLPYKVYKDTACHYAYGLSRLLMPITPFHFGPGLLFKGLSRHVSLSAFMIANCLIDIEPVMAFLLTGDPMHCLMHTYLGATIAAVATGSLARKLSESWLRWWNAKLSPGQARWFRCNEEIPPVEFWVGALVGAWSHVWLDAFMHVDVEPWWPFASGNTAQGSFEMTRLHAFCVIDGLSGLLLLAWRNWVWRFGESVSVRKGILGIAGYGLLAYIGYLYYSLVTGDERLTRLCARILPGMPLEQVIFLAREHGLGPGMPKPGATLAYLVETRSFGRHGCRVEFEDGLVKSATYNFAD